MFSTLFKGHGAEIIATIITPTSTQNPARVEQAEDKEIVLVLTNNSLILLDLKEPPLDVLADSKNSLDLTEDDKS